LNHALVLGVVQKKNHILTPEFCPFLEFFARSQEF
jgi:hypothetical protein